MVDMDEKTIAVARALCAVDGRDPDERMRRPDPEAAGEDDVPPALWEAYVADAERFVVAVEAMQPFLERAKRW